MPVAAQVLAGIAAALHVLFFYLESIAFSKPSTWKGFGVASVEDAAVIKPWALNQGFYNLFLAAGVVAGLVVYHHHPTSYWVTTVGVNTAGGQAAPYDPRGTAIVVFCLGSMLAASIVLAISSRLALIRGVIIQGLAPLIALIIIAAS